MAGEAQSVSRREAMKTALKGSAYASPVVLGALVPPAVAAASPVPPTPVSFAPAPGSPFAVGDGPNGIMVADFNGDGNLDLAVTNAFGNSVSVLLGDGRGSFTTAPGSPFAVSDNPIAIAVGDFNGDGKPDLATANASSSTVNVLLGNGSGAFTNAPGSPITVGNLPLGIAVGDFNGDNKPDLAVVSEFGNSVSVLLGNGGGGFTNAPGSPITVQFNPDGIAVGDFNGDGKPDLAVAVFGSSTVNVLLGNGSGGFMNAPGSPITVQFNPIAIAVGDFNGDGKPDIATANASSNTASVLLGDGRGGFTNAPGSPFAVGNFPDGIAVGDFNGDGKPDIAVINEGSTVNLLLDSGGGSFTNASGSPFALGNGPSGIAVGDFNRDGKLDFAVTNARGNTVSVLLQR